MYCRVSKGSALGFRIYIPEIGAGASRFEVQA